MTKNHRKRRPDHKFFFNELGNLCVNFAEKDEDGNVFSSFARDNKTEDEQTWLLNEFVARADGEEDCQEFEITFCDRDTLDFAHIECDYVYGCFADIVLAFMKHADTSVLELSTGFEVNEFYVFLDLSTEEAAAAIENFTHSRIKTLTVIDAEPETTDTVVSAEIITPDHNWFWELNAEQFRELDDEAKISYLEEFLCGAEDGNVNLFDVVLYDVCDKPGRSYSADVTNGDITRFIVDLCNEDDTTVRWLGTDEEHKVIKVSLDLVFDHE